ncbi:hypothetical protein Lal_00042216 [Lupinus albus]|nr:hypothetical protein Lal_00042216 [Lupinus albus]
MLQLPYQFGRSGMDRLNIPLGSLVFTLLCGIHSRLALGITSSSGWNSSQNPTTSPTSLPPTVSRTSIETEWFHVLSSIGYSSLFLSLFPIATRRKELTYFNCTVGKTDYIPVARSAQSLASCFRAGARWVVKWSVKGSGTSSDNGKGGELDTAEPEEIAQDECLVTEGDLFCDKQMTPNKNLRAANPKKRALSESGSKASYSTDSDYSTLDASDASSALELDSEEERPPVSNPYPTPFPFRSERGRPSLTPKGQSSL